jgi:hypothetical protein
MKEEAKNCRNCGAPLNEQGDCEYCGTKSPRMCSSRIEITADGTRVYTEPAIRPSIAGRMGT